MARTTGPLLSMDASGSVGNALTFAKWKGRNYVRRWAVPSNPRSMAQTSIRAAMQFYTSIYKANESAVIAAFADQAAGLKISPFNAFIQTGLRAWKSSIWIEPDGTEVTGVSTDADITLTGTAQSRGISWSWADVDVPALWGSILLMREGASPGVTTGYAVFGSAAAEAFVATGLLPATSYTARVLMLGQDGVMYSNSADVSVTTSA